MIEKVCIVLSESSRAKHLTRRRYELFKLAKEAFGVKNVWTLDGKIFTNKRVDATDKRCLIKSESDIYKI